MLTIMLWSTTAQVSAQQLQHVVQPGETWRALALRYDQPVSELQQLNPSLNPQREPAIGSSIWLPDLPTQTGRLIRPATASLLLTALSHNAPPAEFGEHAGYLIPHKAYRVAGEQTLLDLPPGFSHFELSHAQALPGEGLALRGRYSEAGDPLVVLQTIDIEDLPFDTFRDGDRIVGLRGVGAFYPPGTQTLTVTVADRPLWSQPWLFAEGTWEFQEITYTGAAAEIDADSIAAERARLFAIWEQALPQALWTGPFQYPIEDFLYRSSGFGARRSYDGGQTYRSYHEGVDFAAYGGTPVYATAAGIVVVAEQLYVRGGAVIINHGLGIYSGYYHLSAVHAQAGDVVSAGDLIGEVGTSGLSTGNHLHWDFLVNGTWVAADRWVDRDLGCWLLEGLGRSCAGEDSTNAAEPSGG